MEQEKVNDEIGKEQVLRRLNAIINEITCMNQGVFDKSIKNGNFLMKFDHFKWGGDSKVRVHISMERESVKE